MPRFRASRACVTTGVLGVLTQAGILNSQCQRKKNRFTARGLWRTVRLLCQVARTSTSSGGSHSHLAGNRAVDRHGNDRRVAGTVLRVNHRPLHRQDSDVSAPSLARTWGTDCSVLRVGTGAAKAQPGRTSAGSTSTALRPGWGRRLLRSGRLCHRRSLPGFGLHLGRL